MEFNLKVDSREDTTIADVVSKLVEAIEEQTQNDGWACGPDGCHSLNKEE